MAGWHCSSEYCSSRVLFIRHTSEGILSRPTYKTRFGTVHPGTVHPGTVHTALFIRHASEVYRPDRHIRPGLALFIRHCSSRHCSPGIPDTVHPDTIHPTYPAPIATLTGSSNRRPGLHVLRCQVLGRPRLGPGILDQDERIRLMTKTRTVQHGHSSIDMTRVLVVT